MRILYTLQDRKWVRRLLVEGRYELPFSFGNIVVSDNRGLPLTEVASPHLIQLQKAIHWPSDIAIPLESGKMKILETTRIKGPLAPNRTAYGLRPSMVQSALGRAYLGFCPADECRRLLDHISQNADKQDRVWVETKRIEEVLKETREQGYSVREKDYWAEPIDFGPDVNAIAVPVFGSDGHAVASLNVIWIREIQPLEDVVGKRLGPLRETADRIGEEYARIDLRLDGPLYFGSVEHVEREIRRMRRKRLGQNHVILCLKGVGQIDLSGADLLIYLIREIRVAGGSVHTVALFPPLLERLRRFHVIDEIGEDHLYISKGDTVQATITEINTGI